MIDLPKPDPEERGVASGAGDGPYLTPTQQNKLVAMMLNPRRRWKLTKAAKAEAVATTVNNFCDKDGRVRNAAVANFIKMEQQNQVDQHKMLDKLMPDERGGGELVDKLKLTLEQVRSDETYGRVRRAAMLGHSSQSGVNGSNGKPGPLGNGSAPRTGG